MRRRKPGRLNDIAEAALAVFTRQGYRNTQMSDVAAEAGVSAGALYSYVASKEALFDLALRCAIDDVPPEAKLPLRLRRLAATAAYLQADVKANGRWPTLAAALGAARAPDPVVELEEVAGELYGLVSARRRLIWLLDQCAWEMPELARVFGEQIRGRYIADFSAYVRKRIKAGQFQAVSEPEAAARAVMEMVVWMAAHRHRDRSPVVIGDGEARATVYQLVVRSLASPRS